MVVFIKSEGNHVGKNSSKMLVFIKSEGNHAGKNPAVNILTDI